MDAYRKPASNSEYMFHFSATGYKNLRALAFRYGNRSAESMLRLVAFTLLRDTHMQLKCVEYSAHDLSFTKNIKMPATVHTELVRIAAANGVPRECLGEMLTNYAVTV
jgi:hypothetical protein